MQFNSLLVFMFEIYLLAIGIERDDAADGPDGSTTSMPSNLFFHVKNNCFLS